MAKVTVFPVVDKTAVAQHNADPAAHPDIRALISGKASIAVVSYIGTGGDSVTINFPFVPSFVIIGPQQDKNENQPSGFNPLEQNYGDRRASIIPYGVDQSYDGRGSIYSLSWSGASLTITKSNNYYTLPCKFYCFAFA